MSKIKKSTKKFAQKKLKGVIKHKRKHSGSHKRSGQDQAGSAGAAAQHDQQQEHKRAGSKKLADMELDEFLDGGFEKAADDSSSGDQEAAAGSSDDPDSADMSDDAGSLDGEDLDLEDGSEDEQSPAAGGDSEDEDADDSSSDDADAAAAGPEAAAVAADNTRLKGAISRHKQQLEALKTKDPEFYAYLQATDAGLLGFGEGGEADDDFEDLSASSSDEDHDDEQTAALAAGKRKAKPAADTAPKGKAAVVHETEDDDEEPASEGEDAAAVPSTSGMHVSSSMVEGWCKAALEKASLGAMMQLIKAYRVACHYGDTEQQMTSTLTISSGAVFNKVMLFMLKEADGIFRRMLGLQADTSSAAAGGSGAGTSGVLLSEQVTKAPRWRKIEPLVKSYLGNSLHLLSSMTQPAMTAYTLRRLRPSVAFLGPFPRLTKKLLKLALELFGSGEKENAPRLQALLLVRQLGLVLPPPALQTCLRGAYRAYAANAKFVSPASLPALAFMAAGVVELSVLDLNVTYQVGFVAIRELAVLLRNALSQKTQDAHKEVYCWQTLNCLELWVKVLSAAAVKGSALQPLVYPLTQLLLGAARLVPTPRYFPIRLRLVRAVNKLAQATGVYVPVAPLLLEMLQWSELKRTPSGGAGAPPDMLLLLRLSKTQLKMASLQEDVIHQVLELLADHLRQWATSVAFPEAAHLPVVALRSFIKGCAVERFRRSARQLLDAIERNVAYVGNARDNVTFAPQELAAASQFLSEDKDVTKCPLIQFATQLLQKAAARMAMRSKSATQDVVLGDDDGSRGRNKRQRTAAEDEDSSSDEEDEQLGDQGLLLAAEASDDHDEEEEIADAAKKHIRQREKRLKRAAAAAAGAAAGQGEVAADRLEEYQLSDDDDAGDEGSEDDGTSEEGLQPAANSKIADNKGNRRGGKGHSGPLHRKTGQKGRSDKQRQGRSKQGTRQARR